MRVEQRAHRQQIEVAGDEGWADGIEGREPRTLNGVDAYVAQAYLNGYALGRSQAGFLPVTGSLELPPSIQEQHALAYVITVCTLVVIMLALVVVFGRG